MTVRAATEHDVPALLAVEDAFRRAGVSHWALMPEPVFRHKIAAREMLVAEAGDGLAGYLMWALLWGYPWIEYVRLYEEQRRRGYGSALVRALEDALRAEGHRMVFSSTTDGEEGPLAWHRALGFHDAGSIGWAWEAPDEVLLVKPL